MKITLLFVLSLMLGIWFLQKKNRSHSVMSSEEMLQTLKKDSKKDDLKIALTKVIEVSQKKTQRFAQAPLTQDPTQQVEEVFFPEETPNHVRFEKITQMLGRPEDLERLRKLVRQELSRTYYPKEAKEDMEVASYLADLLSYEFSIQEGDEESVDFIAQTVQRQSGPIRDELIQAISKLDFQNKPKLKDELKRRGIYLEK